MRAHDWIPAFEKHYPSNSYACYPRQNNSNRALAQILLILINSNTPKRLGSGQYIFIVKEVVRDMKSQQQFHPIFSLLSIIIFSFTLAACGGNGSSDGTPPADQNIHTLDITSAPPLLTTERELYEYQLLTFDSDSNSSAVLTYELKEGPAGMAVSITGLVTWTPPDTVGSPYTVTLAVNNTAANLSQVQTFALTVLSSDLPSQALDVGDIGDGNGPQIGLLDLSVTPAILSFGKLSDNTINNASPITFNNQDLNQNLIPNRGLVIPDFNGNGAADVALFGKRVDDNELAVEVRDLKDGPAVLPVDSQYLFGSGFEFIDAVIVSDLNGDGAQDLAVLAYDAATPKVKIEFVDLVKAKTDPIAAQISIVLLDSGSMPIEMAIVPDIDGNQIDELAVLMQNKTTNAVKVIIDNVSGGFKGAPIQTLTYGSDATAEGLLIIGDINLNDKSEVAVLGRNYNVGSYRYRLHDALTNELIERPWFPDAVAAMFTANVGDVSDPVDAIDDIATVAYSLDSGDVDVIINSAKDGTRIRQMEFNSVNKNLLPKDMIVLPDMNANGSNEIALLCVKLDTRNRKIEIRDASTRAVLNSIDFN